MPVTVKFSEDFYDKLGHEVVQELVDWFNQVDATYRTDLRELNELNFARFDAKLEQRIAELRAELHKEIAMLRADMKTGFARSEAKLTAFQRDFFRSMLFLWTTSVLTIIGVVITLFQVLR